jgi:hypothetical protein
VDVDSEDFQTKPAYSYKTVATLTISTIYEYLKRALTAAGLEMLPKLNLCTIFV